MYDPTIGQWLSADPIEDDKENTYRYVGNDPLNKVDPTGLAEEEIPATGLKIDGGVVSVSTSPVKGQLFAGTDIMRNGKLVPVGARLEDGRATIDAADLKGQVGDFHIAKLTGYDVKFSFTPSLDLDRDKDGRISKKEFEDSGYYWSQEIKGYNTFISPGFLTESPFKGLKEGFQLDLGAERYLKQGFNEDEQALTMEDLPHYAKLFKAKTEDVTIDGRLHKRVTPDEETTDTSIKVLLGGPDAKYWKTWEFRTYLKKEGAAKPVGHLIWKIKIEYSLNDKGELVENLTPIVGPYWKDE